MRTATLKFKTPELQRGLLLASLLATISLSGCMGTMPTNYSQTNLPDAIKVPSGQKVALETRTEGGEITYECRAKKEAPNVADWTFVGPSATLTDRSGKPIGMYYGPPATWEAKDGSKITGTQVAVAPSGAGNLPFQLVKANPANQAGWMQGVSYIQRVALKGGVAPKTVCSTANLGQQEIVPYQADYIFWKAM